MLFPSIQGAEHETCRVGNAYATYYLRAQAICGKKGCYAKVRVGSIFLAWDTKR